ncbi:prepilin-type N-terminal cleavage/methylation domain-containing protein [Rhodoplanes sp. TEM]|uniref:Prepilin-type N-terminal cleavage/methylation domain-containing protein n=1 Tax=Rhodoplanes tepidamans TaxID=200616 RepID=A0ABT5JCC4_RHOTP|nr:MULTISPECIES: prepilin-type N-terminal cleavage/methylation domain-containing protein [Rhodoplanes]MDC7787289.1 prepilin-type N-terminal cleavage/methylation domain-containing protein [Rhodoplanes tepidamans]MDC7985317.1 prepilin-type N-terminal cleavage/methylation domain-containing protein [Rhodoplanes sp. TEM]
MRGGAQAGFGLVEIVAVVAIVAALAALALPRLPLGTSTPRLQAYAVEAAALLRADRTAAMRRRRPVATEVNAAARALRSGATGRILRLPRDVRMQAMLPQRCAGRPALSSIGFLPSGLSCGGAVVLSRDGVGFEVRVNWLTGGVEIVPRHSA